MIIAGFNQMRDDFVIENYSNLEKLVLRKNTLQRINSLKISNNEKLKSIETEDCDYFDNGSHDGGCFSVNKVIFESMINVITIISISSKSTIIQIRRLLIL